MAQQRIALYLAHTLLSPTQKFYVIRLRTRKVMLSSKHLFQCIGIWTILLRFECSYNICVISL